MRTMHLLLLLFLNTAFFVGGKPTYYFPEYKFYYTPDSCTEETCQTINGFRYLRIKFSSNCKEVEVGCYRDGDSTLIEQGRYRNNYALESHKTIARSVSGSKSKVGKARYYKLKRMGTWDFFDSTGRVINSIKY